MFIAGLSTVEQAASSVAMRQRFRLFYGAQSGDKNPVLF